MRIISTHVFCTLMADQSLYHCPLCGTFSSRNFSVWLSHIGQVHRNDSVFVVTCGFDGCSETKRSYSALYSHVYRKHSELIRKRQPSIPIPSETLPSLPSSSNEDYSEELGLFGEFTL